MNILIAGDFCPMFRVADLINKEDYKSVFEEVLEFTKKVDYSIVNLEAPIVETEAKPIDKCGPNLKCTSNAIKALKYAGFDMVTLANNHFYDYGEDGVKQTLDACQKEGIDVVGGGMNITDATKILYKEIKGVNVAFINCCEHEFSIATETSGGSNPLNPIQQYYAIKEAKQNADKVIMIVHGGHEHYQLPSLRMKETYRFFINIGADVVINHHQHCYSGYEIYNGKPIFYGLGNFCFDRGLESLSIWNEGYMVILNLNNPEIDFKLIPYVQGYKKAGVELITDIDNFNSRILEINKTISDYKLLKEAHENWMNGANRWYQLQFEPYHTLISETLFDKNLLPSFINKKKKYKLLNYLQCEAHLERMIHSLKNLKK